MGSPSASWHLFPSNSNNYTVFSKRKPTNIFSLANHSGISKDFFNTNKDIQSKNIEKVYHKRKLSFEHSSTLPVFRKESRDNSLRIELASINRRSWPILNLYRLIREEITHYFRAKPYNRLLYLRKFPFHNY